MTLHHTPLRCPAFLVGVSQFFCGDFFNCCVDRFRICLACQIAVLITALPLLFQQPEITLTAMVPKAGKFGATESNGYLCKWRAAPSLGHTNTHRHTHTHTLVRATEDPQYTQCRRCSMGPRLRTPCQADGKKSQIMFHAGRLSVIVREKTLQCTTKSPGGHGHAIACHSGTVVKTEGEGSWTPTTLLTCP